MFAVPRLLAVATAVPPYPLDQSDVVERVKLLFGRSPDLDRLLPVFLNTGIHRRYSCVPIEWYDRAHGWPERNRIYLASALDLLEAATEQVLRLTGRDKDDIDSIVVVSTTGIATPSLDALLMERMGLRRTVRRLPIFGLGCAGGVARACARRQPSCGRPRQDGAFSGRRIVRVVLPARRLVEEQYCRDGSVWRWRRGRIAIDRRRGAGHRRRR